MKGDISEVISDFIKNKREQAVDPEKNDEEGLKNGIIKKLVTMKFGGKTKAKK